jgi:hypothetical protein
MVMHAAITIEWPLLQSNVSALIDMKLEKYKNIREESAFFWGEISEGTLKFDRKQEEVCTHLIVFVYCSVNSSLKIIL